MTSKEVHIWKFLISSHVNFQKLVTYLSEQELIESQKFYFVKDRRLSIASKFMLKKLLSTYLNQDMKSIKIVRNKFNKPFISGNEISFNLSHSEKAIIVAIAKQHDVGADVEDNTKSLDVLSIVDQYFSKHEIQSLKNTAPQNQLAVFYNLWTRKEAFIKAIGQGLSIPLDKFTIESSDKNFPQILFIDWQQEKTDQWSIYSFKPFKNYQASCAVRCPQISFKEFEFEI